MHSDSDKVIKTLELILAQARQGIVKKIKVSYEDVFGSIVDIEEPPRDSEQNKYS